MKSIKFLAALALPAMFAACTNEDLVAVQEDLQQNNEFVGAELIGTGISMNVGSTESRATANGTYTLADKLGLGWAVYGNYGDDQFETNLPNKPNMYGNHLFYCVDVENQTFETKANVFKGWHFAYFPHEYTAKDGQVKKITVNPDQTESYELDLYNTSFNVSGLAFLERDDFDDNLQLKPGRVEYRMFRAFNTINVGVEPSTTFTENEDLKVLNVTSIKMNVGKGILAREMQLDPSKLVAIGVDENGEYNETEIKASLDQALTKAEGVSLSKTLTTQVNNSDINLTDKQVLRIHTAPVNPTSINVEEVVFTINVDGGFFTVDYETTNPTEADEYNNLELEKLAAAFAEGGRMTKAMRGKAMMLNFKLTAGMFTPDFSKIQSEEAWNKAVTIVDALGMETAPFTIVKNADGENWKFEDIDGDGNLINLPKTAALTIGGEDIILNAAGEWKQGQMTINTNIVVEENLTVAETMSVADGYTITNKNVMTVVAGGKVSNLNNETRVIAEYGAFVAPKAAAQAGIIAYNVTELDVENPQRIVDVIAISGNDYGHANVNTLVIAKDFTLDLNKPYAGTEGTPNDNPYNDNSTAGSAAGEANYGDLNGVNFEINGGTLKATGTTPITIGGATMKSGNIENIAIGTLTIEEGTNNVNVSNPKAISSVMIKGGNNTIHATEISSVVSESGYNAIHATKVNGEVAVEGTFHEIVVDEIGGAVTVDGNAVIESKMNANVNILSGQVKFNEFEIGGTLTVAKQATVVLNNNTSTMKIGNIENLGKLYANNDIYTGNVNLHEGSETYLKGNGSEEYDKVIWYTGSSNHTNVLLGGNVKPANDGVANGNKANAFTQTGLESALTTSGVTEVKVAVGEYTFPSSSIAEGVTIICEEGTTFTGNSKLNINGATVVGATFSNPSGTAVDQTINGTFKNCTFTGSNGARWCYAGETVVFEDCVFDGSVYGVHFDGGANEIIFRNCTLSGFNALAGAVTMVTFEGCTFKGNGKSGYNGANLWGSAKLIGCEFTFDGSTANEWIDCIGADKTYEFTNCTVNGVSYTDENYKNYEELIFSRNNTSVKINGVDCQM